MKIYEALGLDINEKKIISFVGGGGKTTTIFSLARELSEENKKILISTTTKIFNPEKKEYDYYFLGNLNSQFNPLKATITILGEGIENAKLIGVSPEKIDAILDSNIFDFILIEADGSNRKSIKAPASYEPIIPSKTMITIGVIGLDCVNKPINENTVHRSEMLKKIPGNEDLDIIDENVIVNLVIAEQGLFKNSKGRKLLLLNKADNSNSVDVGKKIIEKLKKKKFSDAVVGTIMKKNFF